LVRQAHQPSLIRSKILAFQAQNFFSHSLAMTNKKVLKIVALFISKSLLIKKAKNLQFL
jgi:hypothetical protein